MLDTGDTSSPGAKYLHMVRPSQPVWVDLAVVYPTGEPKAAVPDGLDLTAIIPGTLGIWQATTTGHWVGWVNFVLGTIEHGGTRHQQWVLPEALRPRSE